jgi:hypothetical protein
MKVDYTSLKPTCKAKLKVMHDNSNKNNKSNNNNNNDHKSNIGKQINRAAITGGVRVDIPAKRLIKG